MRLTLLATAVTKILKFPRSTVGPLAPRSRYVLHVTGSMTVAELRHADVLGASFKLSGHRHQSFRTHAQQAGCVHTGWQLTLSLCSGPSMETSSISSPMLTSLLDKMERWLKTTETKRCFLKHQLAPVIWRWLGGKLSADHVSLPQQPIAA